VESTAFWGPEKPGAQLCKNYGAACSYPENPGLCTNHHGGAGECMPVLKNIPLTLLFFLLSLSFFHFQLDILWPKLPAIFQGKKVHLIVVFCFKNSLALLLQQRQLTKKVLFLFLFSLNSFI